MLSIISRSVKPATSISFHLAKRPFTEKSYDDNRRSELQEGVDRLVKHVCIDMIDESTLENKQAHAGTKLFFSEERSPMVWSAQNISMKDVVQFMRSKGADITPYIVYNSNEE